MILVGLSILAAIALLIVIVWALHRNQQQQNLESVDRTLPLPPVELRESEVVSAEDILGLVPRQPSAIQRKNDNNSTASAVQPPDAAVTAENWLARSRELQELGRYDAALAFCHSALPQMGAFRQGGQVLRAQIRAEKKNKQPHEQTLKKLYQLAALADFFHSRTDASKPLSLVLLKRVNMQQWLALACPYETLGFKKLSLLTTTDCKWLQDAWGEPVQHSDMRNLYPEQWQLLTQTQ